MKHLLYKVDSKTNENFYTKMSIVIYLLNYV